MFQLVYHSSATARVDAETLRGILVSSRRRNAACGVTGLLIHHRGGYLQALEGDEVQVEDVFAAIAADARHRDIAVTARHPVPERAFGHWAMASQDMADAVRGPAIAALVDHLIARVPDAPTRALFSQFVREGRPPA